MLLWDNLHGGDDSMSRTFWRDQNSPAGCGGGCCMKTLLIRSRLLWSKRSNSNFSGSARIVKWVAVVAITLHLPWNRKQRNLKAASCDITETRWAWRKDWNAFQNNSYCLNRDSLCFFTTSHTTSKDILLGRATKTERKSIHENEITSSTEPEDWGDAVQGTSPAAGYTMEASSRKVSLT